MTDIIINSIRELRKKVTTLISYELNENQVKLLDDTADYTISLVQRDIFLNIIRAEKYAEIIINETGAGIKTLCAAILYSIQSNETINLEEISKNISPEVADIIEGLLKIPTLNNEKFSKNTENFIKLLLTVSGDVRSILIRLVQQIHTMRNIAEFPKEKQITAAQQTDQLFAPLAHRLGLYKIKTELEETAMKYTENEMYKNIAKKLSETKKTRDLYIQNFVEPINKKLQAEGLKFVLKGRPKSIFSIWNKMKKQNVSFEEVYDLFAIRVILEVELDKEKDVCWKVYSIITDKYRPNPKRLRDWISSPKVGGYESLHTTVLGPENKWIEVQIRTQRMDEIAEKGPAAHWIYKDSGKGSGTDWLTKMREAIENPQFDDEKSGNKAKAALYSPEIFVFTPEGDLRSLKPGYTVLDFAFSIHTKIGETCSGAIVNGIIKPLNHEIQNGDTVKILTNKNKKPNDEWLTIAKSTRVKNKIRQLLKIKSNKDAEAGKDTLKQKMAQLKIYFSEKSIQQLSDYFKLDSSIRLYQNIGDGKIDIHKIKKAFDEISKKNDTEEELKEIKTTENPENQKNKFKDYLLIDQNLTTLDYKLSKCCNPIPGDKIFGFITVAKGTRIHKESCPNAVDLKKRYPYRVVNAMWNDKNIAGNFITNIYIAGKDQTGITVAISNIISNDFKMKIKAIAINERKNDMFDGTVVVYAKDRTQILSLMERLKKIKDITIVREK